MIDTLSWAEVNEVTNSVFGVEDISSIDWSVDGNWIAYGSSKGCVLVINSHDWKLLAPSEAANVETKIGYGQKSQASE